MSQTRDQLQLHLQKWMMRKTVSFGVRHVGDLPIALASDLGLVRSENQDRLAVLRLRDRTRSFLLAVICDGMGGMADGALCASIALSSFLAACVWDREKPIEKRLLTAASFANENVFAAFQGNGGATLSAFLVDNTGKIAGVNIGDSRIYGGTNGLLNQLTVDDTIAGQIKRQEELKGDFPTHRELLQFIGVGSGLEPHIITLPSSSNDFYILLTTDGIHSVPHHVMQSVFFCAGEPALAIRRLAELSKWCGGSDNASAIAATSLPSIKDLNGDHTTGVIEVWDAFGELQIVAIDGDQPSEPRYPLYQPDQIPAGEATQVEQPKASPAKTKPPRQKRKTKPKKPKKPFRKKATTKDDTGKEMEDIKPQLKIDFDKI